MSDDTRNAPRTPAVETPGNDVNPVCGCRLRSRCDGCGTCTSCDGCYCDDEYVSVLDEWPPLPPMED